MVAAIYRVVDAQYYTLWNRVVSLSLAYNKTRIDRIGMSIIYITLKS